MDREAETISRRKILKCILKPQKSVRQFITSGRKKIVDIFLNIRKSDYKISLKELKEMDFTDAVLIIQKTKKVQLK